MKRFLLLLIALLISSTSLLAQGGNTTVTATIRDPNNALYTNSQVNISFLDPPTDHSGKLPLLNGSTFQTSYTIFATDSFGKFTQSVADNGAIDTSSGTQGTEWSFRVIYSDRATSFVYVTPINCALNIPATCIAGVMDISAQLQAVAAIIPGAAGGGGAYVVRNLPCTSSLGFQMAGSFPTTANTAFNVNMTCNVTSSTVTQAGSGLIQTGAIAQFTLIQDNIGGHSFAWPANFIDQPSIQVGANTTTNASFWYDGTNWHAQTFPAAGGGGGSNPAGVNGDVQANNGGGALKVAAINDTGSAINIKEDAQFAGPNPVVDLRAYNVRSACTTSAPCAPGITATTTNGQPTITLSSASTFQNKDGVTIFGAGAAHSMSTPTISSVTPSNAAGPTVTGTVVAAPAGSTTYNYKIMACNTSQGCTAASTTVSTTTGAATLGYNTVAITSQSRSGTVATVTTSSPHAISVGTVVQVSQAADGSEFSGTFVVATVPDNTHFTYNNGVDTTNGFVTSTTSTGGTVAWFANNHLLWPSTTGAFHYIIYSDRANPGTFAPIAISRPGDLYWDDYGSPMMDGILMPYFVPSTPPVAATANSLTTTILSGAGTTNLILNANAGTSVSGATILFDNAPTFAAAATANTGGTLYFPAGGTYTFNSYVSVNANISLGGSLWLNDTIQIQGKWNGGLTPTANLPPQFSLTSANIITINRANPGLYGPNFSSGNLTNLQFALQGKAGRAVLVASSSALYDRLVCQLQANDYATVCLELNGALPGGAGSFFNKVNDSTFVGNQGIHTTTPILAFTHNNGHTQVENTSLSGAGIQYDGGEAYLKGGRDQGGVMPVLQVTGGGATVSFINFDEDTMGYSLVANLAGPSTRVYTFNAGAPSFDGVSVQPLITGLPYSYSASPFGITSPNQSFSVAGFGGVKVWSPTSVYPVGGNSVASPVVASAGYQMLNPQAPTLSISGASGPAAGTYFYALEAVDALNNPTTMGTVSASITVNGSQGVLVTYPTPPLGAVSWNVCRGTSPGGMNCAGVSPFGTAGSRMPISQTTFLDTGGSLATATGFNPSNFATSSFASSGVVGAPSIVTVGSNGFTSTASATLTANRTVTEPDFSYTRAGTNIAQTFTANQSIATGSSLRFFDPNGTNFTALTGPGTNGSNVTFQLPNADSSGVQCISSNGSGVLAFSNCSGGTGTPGGSNKNLQYNSSSSFGGASNLNYTSATGILDLSQLANSNNTITGHRFTDTSPTGNWLTLQNAALGSTLFNVDVAGNLIANSLTITTPLSYANGGTNTSTSFTNNQLVAASGGSLSSLTGTLTGTNPVLTLTSSAIGNVPFALNTPASPTADLFDLNINSVKTSWVDNSGIWHAPSYTAAGTGALALSGTEGTCPSTAAGIDILCIGNSTNHTIQSSLNGNTYKDIPQWANSGPAAHGVVVAATQFPQTNATSPGTTGQAFVSSGSGADPAFGTLGPVGGGLGTTTNTLHGILLGEGTSPVNASTAGTSGQAFISGGAGADGAYGALNFAGGSSIITGVCPITNGCTGSSTLAGANIATVTGAITVGHCTQWSASTVITDSGAACGGSGGAARLDQITAATLPNTINSTTNPQTWNWALTGSTTAFKFGENTAATGSSNILLQATTANTSTASPFQTDNNGNGYGLSSAGLWRPVGTGAIATPGAAHNLVVSQGGSSTVTYVPPVAAGKVLIDNGPGNDPTFQDPIISQAYVNLWTAQDITVTRTSAAVRNPVFSQTGTLQLTFASITGSPSGCTLQIQGVDSQGNALNDGSTFAITPANGTTSQQFTATAGLLTAAQVRAIYACSTYPTAGTLTLDFTPIPNVNVTNTVQVAGTVTTTPPSNASTNLTQVAGSTLGSPSNYGTSPGAVTVPGVNAFITNSPAISNLPTTVDTNNGTTSASTVRVTVSSDSTGQAIPAPTTASGDAVSACNILSAASTNATNCKNAAGNFYGYEIYNTTTTIYYLRLYNLSAAPTCSSATGFIRTVPIPPAGASGQAGGAISNQIFPVNYGTGIGYCITGGSSSTDNTNAATGIFGEIRYK